MGIRSKLASSVENISSLACSAARIIVLHTLTKLKYGSILIQDTNGITHRCGPANFRSISLSEEDQDTKRNITDLPQTTPSAELKILRDVFWLRCALYTDLGFAESYLMGEIACSDLATFFKILILNRAIFDDFMTIIPSSVANGLRRLIRSTNTTSRALLNAEAHYSLSNTMFSAFLSNDMTYSCPMWAYSISQDQIKESLESAQLRKLHYSIDAAHIKSTDHVLEIGTGWGSFAIAAVKATGCKVTTITLSSEQKILAEERIRLAGMSNSIDVLICDYRKVPLSLAGPSGRYDKIVSIEMIEHVGAGYLDKYFECIHYALKPAGGIAVFQCITIPEPRYDAYLTRGEDFIQKYIFAGGHLPTVSGLVASIARASKGSLIVEDIKSIGGHYPKALRDWGERFSKTFEDIIWPALLQQQPHLDDTQVDVFRRKWKYYFSYCEAGFGTKTLGDVVITVGREGTMEFLEGIPV